MQQPSHCSTSHSLRKRSFSSSWPYLQSIALVLICSAIMAAPQAAQAGVNTWTSLGPEGGSVTALAIDPQNTAIVYLATQNAGIFKSTDSGSSWQPSSAGLLDHLGNQLYIEDLAINSTTPATLFAATSDGVFKSIDAGASWQAANQGVPAFSVYSLAFDPATPTTVYAGHAFGLFKSVDGGVSWQDLRNGLDNNRVNAVAIDPTNAATLWAGTDRGVFKSVDGGQNWSVASTGLPADRSVYALIVHPTNPNTIFAGAYDSTGVYKSTNGGTNWSAASTGLTDGYVQALAIQRDNPTILYAGSSSGVYKSTNSAATWSFAGTGLTIPNIEALALDPLNPTTLWAGTLGGGVFKSNDSGSHWNASNQGLRATYIDALTIDPQTSATLYVSSGGGRLFKSTNSGTTWNLSSKGLLGNPLCGQNALAIDAKTPATLYAGTRSGVYKSTDGAANWTNIFGTFFIFRCVVSLTVDPTASNHIYLGLGDTFYKSTDSGANWTIVTAGLPNNNQIALNAILVDPQTPTTLYLGTDNGIYKSTNRGSDWQASSNGLPGDTQVNTLVIHPQTTSTLFAATEYGVYKSTDNGLNWAILNITGTNAFITALALSPQTPTILLAGWSEGVFSSTDGGENWQKINTGLTNRNIQTLAFDPQSPATAYVGTGGGGAFVGQIVPAPRITIPPASQTIQRNQSATLSVAATDATSLSYQWYQGTSGDSTLPLDSASANSFTTPPLVTTTQYWVRITNAAGGSVDSDTAVITVISPEGPTILTQPASQTINSGKSTTLAVVTRGTALTFQWYGGNSGDTSLPIVGAITGTLTTPALTTSSSFWVRVSNSVGSVDSATAIITVLPPPQNIQITSQPASQNITSGQSVSLSVTAMGDGLIYQWYQGNSGDTTLPLGGATTDIYTTPALTTTTNYWVRVSNAHSSVDSTTVTITVQPVLPNFLFLPIILNPN